MVACSEICALIRLIQQGASTYTFARAAMGQNLAQWIDCHVHAFEFFGGATTTDSDNPRPSAELANTSRISIARITRWPSITALR